MSCRHLIAAVAALLCTSAFAQGQSPVVAAMTGATASVVAATTGDADKGKEKAFVCGACHGADGNSADAQYPRLAGQGERYIVLQLEQYKSGERVDPIMAGMAATLSTQDMHDLAAWFSSQAPQYGVADEALVDAGQALYRGGDAARGIPACAACHGPAGAGNTGAAYPHLAGQHADYVQKTLEAWRDGAVWGDAPLHQIMPAIAERLTDADITAVSSYIEGLHPAGN